jgi:hypothetical protein
LTDRILEAVPRACASPALAAQFRVAEAASGVAAYLAAPEADPAAAIDTPRLCALLSAALEASGDHALACRIRSFGSAIVYAGEWHAVPGERIWILNVGRLIEPGENGLEMLLFERLRTVIDSFADVWDAAQGHGILGLRDLRGGARRVISTDAGERRVAGMSEAIRCFCADRLARLQERRQWAAAPTVMCLHS